MERVFSLPFKMEKKEAVEIKLARKAIKGDETSFVELVKIYKVPLYKIAYSYVKDEQKALDILQECTYKGLLGIEKLEKPEFFKTWITRILINLAINTNKKDSKVVYLSDDMPLVYSEKSINVEEKLDLYDAIDNLRDKYRAVIILRYFESMSIEEISYAMDIPVNTVKSHLRRAKEALGASLKEGYLND